MQVGPWQILIVAIVVLVLFGRGKISNLMGEVGKGITAFKRGVKDGTEEANAAAAEIAKDVTPVQPSAAQQTAEKDKV